MKANFLTFCALLAVGCSQSASALPDAPPQVPNEVPKVDETRPIRRTDLPGLMAKHKPPFVHEVPADPAITFDRVDVIIEPGFPGRGESAFLSVGREGSYFYKVHSAPGPGGRDAVGASLVERLPADRLTELERILESTDWLTAKGGEGAARHTDAAMMTFAVTRAGKTRIVLMQGMRPAPYDALQKFFFDLAWQEDIYHRLTALPVESRDALRDLHTAIEDSLGLRGRAAPAHHVDYARFEGLFLRWLENWDTSSTDELRATIDLMVLLERSEHAGKIARLRNDRDSALRSTVARALPSLAKEKAILWLVDMLRATAEARIQLIRLGDPAVPVVAKLIAGDETRDGPQSIALIRACVDNWQTLPQPIDERIVQAVLANMQLEARRNDLQYQREFLKLAGVAEPKPATIRETAESFLKHLKAGDEAALLKLKDNVGSLEKWLALRDSLDPQAAIEVETLLVDGSSAFLQTKSLKNKNGEEVHLVVYLNLLRGTDWRVGPALEEPAERTLYKQRFMESYPAAAEDRARSSK